MGVFISRPVKHSLHKQCHSRPREVITVTVTKRRGDTNRTLQNGRTLPEPVGWKQRRAGTRL